MAKSNLSYKKATTITLKAAGMVDIKKGTITVDGEEVAITALLKDFDGIEVDISCKIKQEEYLDPNFDEEFDPDDESDE